MAAKIDTEFPGMDLGDERRNRRLVRFAQRMAEHPQRSVKSACRGAAESTAAYRLMHRPEVNPEQILGPHQKAVLERAAKLEGGDVLLVQDTTELDFSTHKALKGSGPLAEKNRRGFFAHARLLISEKEGVPLGLCGCQFWARRDEDAGLSKERKKRPIEQKESFRWISTYHLACQLATELGSRRIIVTGDRENDIYEFFEAREKAHAQQSPHYPAPEFVVRSGRNRALSGEMAGNHLFDYLHEKAPVLGQYRLQVEAKEQLKKKSGGSRVKTQRSARKVRLEVRACQVTLRGPYRPGGKLEDITLWAVMARELDPPKGEEYFRVLKTGCKVEEIALRDDESLLPAVAVSMIVAWRILYLRGMMRSCGHLPATTCFDPAEWKAVWMVASDLKPAEERAPPSLGQMLREVAKLGGHHGRPSDRPPGVQCIWEGLQRVRHYVEAFEAIGAL